MGPQRRAPLERGAILGSSGFGSMFGMPQRRAPLERGAMDGLPCAVVADLFASTKSSPGKGSDGWTITENCGRTPTRPQRRAPLERGAIDGNFAVRAVVAVPQRRAPLERGAIRSYCGAGSLDPGASTKGSPGKGSDSPISPRPPSTRPGLNEGLPWKGERYQDKPERLVADEASTKGSPGKGSDQSVSAPVSIAEMPQRRAPLERGAIWWTWETARPCRAPQRRAPLERGAMEYTVDSAAGLPEPQRRAPLERGAMTSHPTLTRQNRSLNEGLPWKGERLRGRRRQDGGRGAHCLNEGLPWKGERCQPVPALDQAAVPQRRAPLERGAIRR